MIRLLFLRTAAVVASLIFLAGPSFGATDTKRPVGGLSADGFRLDRARIWFDSGCTDSFNTPATTVNVNLTTIANWNSMATAVNPDRNVNDATQTSGSADGWCDSSPWIMKGSLTGAGTVYIGPFKTIPYQGFLLEWNFSAAFGNYSFFFCHKSLLDTTLCRQDGGNAAIATTGNLVADITPGNPGAASQYASFDNFWFVQNRPSYLQLTLAGAGAYTFSVATEPVLPYYESRGD